MQLCLAAIRNLQSCGGVLWGEFRSLTDAEVERYMDCFAQPEEIIQKEVEESSGFTFISM